MIENDIDFERYFFSSFFLISFLIFGRVCTTVCLCLREREKKKGGVRVRPLRFLTASVSK